MAEAARHPDRPVVLATGIAPPQGLVLPPNLYVLATGGESANVGLVRAAARIEDGKAWLLVSARSAPGAVGPCTLRVTGDDKELARREGFLPSGRTAEIVLPLQAALPKRLRVDLCGPGAAPQPPGDGFPWDDTAYLVLEQTRRRTILLVGSPDPVLRQALAALRDTRVFESDAGPAAPLEGVDLVIACGAPLPVGWKGPAAVVAPAEAVGPVRPLEGEADAAWHVEAAHPLASALYLEAPEIGKVRRYELARGADLLLGTPALPLAATWQADGARRLAVLFPLDEKTTDWSHRPGFPIFWMHAADWLAPAPGTAQSYVTYAPLAALPGHNRWAPEAPGFYENEGVGVSFIGAEEPFESGPARDDSAPAVEAIRASAAAHRTLAYTDLWPLLALAVLAALVARAAWR